MKRIILKAGKERAIRHYHPWIFSGAIHQADSDIQDGELVAVYDVKHLPLAVGMFNVGSIAVRILEFQTDILSPDFWLRSLKQAWDARSKLGLPNAQTTGFRLVHGEGDSLPGLIIDMYGANAVIQFHAVGMWNFRDVIVEALEQSAPFSLETIYNRSADTLPSYLEVTNGHLKGVETQTIFLEEGIRFTADWGGGQKTGFFLDQRENRRLIGTYAKGKRVLNTFSYSGGFSIPCLLAGAERVHSVDISKVAVQLASTNVALNGDFPNHVCESSDAFAYLESIEKNAFNIIVLDPPAFAKSRKVLTNASRGYQRLNRLAFEKIESGGMVFTYSCSQAIDTDLFRKIVFAAAQESGRQVRILHQLTQGPDHPINIYHPEGEYLKGLVLLVY